MWWFKATLLISRASCKHQLTQAVHGGAAVDSRKQLKENTPKAVTAHSPNSSGYSAARERLQTKEEKFTLLLWECFQAPAACERRYCPWEKALSANCKPPVWCKHLSLSRSPRALFSAPCGVIPAGCSRHIPLHLAMVRLRWKSHGCCWLGAAEHRPWGVLAGTGRLLPAVTLPGRELSPGV